MSSGFLRSTTKKVLDVFEAGRRSSTTICRKQPLKLSRNMYFPFCEATGLPFSWSKGYSSVGSSLNGLSAMRSIKYLIYLLKTRRTESFLPGFKWRITAHKLATTEQSVVMSCTRSQSVFATMIFSYSSGPESLKSSAGRFQPSNISVCLLENENVEGSLQEFRTQETVNRNQR